MTTFGIVRHLLGRDVVEAYRLDRYDNFALLDMGRVSRVVEAYRLDRYDNF